MKKIFQKQFNNYKGLLDSSFQKIKKSLWYIGKNAFLFIIILVLLNIVFGEFLFYNYVLLAKIKASEIVDTPNRFKENVYRSVLKEWQDREIIFRDSTAQNLKDPFQ